MRSRPVCYDGRVFVPTEDGKIVAVETREWRRTSVGPLAC
ncbi:MAG: PQQ-binding-like beta-propeller repeat protein [Spirochaetales bacterium]|nr:PQQ-binding-like beta-propeller repeat protein [Leptospiraceae bacterium]MCP5480145.1 PQQ-binding-like beta-propeller repeat protein [Spirochaetales bacterium]MCP5485515.1 PQQ-binding-like beta-propeller repeat protein [Spirochaetales bacterium]